MKIPLPQSLRVRLVLLVAISALPAMAIMTYTAFERYHTARNYAFGISQLSADRVVTHYRDLVSRSQDVLTLMAKLPEVGASPQECTRALGELRTHLPLYANLSVFSLNGEFRCSAVPLKGSFNVSGRAWFREVLGTRRFTSGVIPRGFVTGRSLLIFSAPQFGADGKLIGVLNVVISPEALEPPETESLLARYGALTVFSEDGTLLMRYPQDRNLLGSNQSGSALFQALQAAPDPVRRSLLGIDGKLRIFTLRRVASDVPQHSLLIASGIDVKVLRVTAFTPLVWDLIIVAVVALLIMLATWWAASALVMQQLRHLLQTMQRIGRGDWQAGAELTETRGEFGLLAAGIKRMAVGLETQAQSRRAIEQARTASEHRYSQLIEQSVEAITVRHASGDYVLVNAAFCKMLGYSREELLRMRLTDLIDPAEQRGNRLLPGESARFESWMYHKDGHKVPVEVSTLRLPNGDIQSVQRDIGERLEVQRRLEDSERQYRELVEQAVSGLLVRRADGEILFVNRALCQMTGYRRDQLVGMYIGQLVDFDEAQVVQRNNQLAKGAIASFKSRLRHQDGHAIHVEVSVMRREDGNIQSLVHDVSARLEAEGRLLEERQFVLNALDVLPGVFYVFDANGKFLRWNRQMEEISGYNMQQMREITAADIVPPDRRGKHSRMVQEILQGSSTHGETEFFTKDGRRIPYYYAAHNFMWRGQSCVVGMGVDISAQKQAEDKLHEEQALLSHAINSLPGLFTLCTDQGKFLMWNQHLEEVSGYTAEDLQHLSPLALIAPEQRALMAQRIAEVFTRGRAEVEADLLCRDGRRIPHFFTGRRLEFQGKPCLAGVALDITALRDAEQHVQAYLHELQQLSPRILQAQEDERRRLAGELHDEMGQSLLTVVLQLRELEARAPQAQRAAIRKISALASELSEQVRGLSLDLRPAMLDDLGLAATLRWYMRERVAVSGLQVTLEIDKRLPRLPALTEITCFRVLQSALTNVVKHAQAHQVQIAVHVHDDALHFSVQDDGQGFDVDAARRRAAAGRSFGLLGMQERVRFAGGEFELSSATGRGTKIEVRLPLAEMPGKPSGADTDAANSGGPGVRDAET
ncbi:MAG: PAS domain S-box protein [Gammaproteobacteria bacterium]|nr:PAS domain S-box protein [Gammaproteobacteria bacterium]